MAASVKQVIQENIGENIIMLNNKIYVGKLQYIKFELLQYYNVTTLQCNNTTILWYWNISIIHSNILILQ